MPHQQGQIVGDMEALGFQVRQEAVLETLTTDVIETSEIEGEKLDVEQVRSSIDGAQTILSGVLSKTGFWKRSQGVPLNDRQRLVLNRLLDGFDGKLTTSTYAKLTKCSADTALRDIQSLLQAGFSPATLPAGAAPAAHLLRRPLAD